MTALLFIKTARDELPAPFSFNSLSIGYQAYMGPVEIIPAVIDSMIPLMPAPFPRKLAIYAGFKKRFRAIIRIKTRPNGIIILEKIIPLLLRARKALSGINAKIIPYTTIIKTGK